MTCPHCGRENQRLERFCDGCGAFLGWDAGQSADSPVFVQQESQPNDQRAGVQIEIKNDLIEVAPGNAASTAFTIKNLGTKVEEFRLSLSGPEWLAVEPTTVRVFPGVEATGTMQAAPPRKPGTVAGVTPFRVTVTSALHANVSSSASGRINVAPFYEFVAELIPTSSSGRRLTRHRVTLDNRGNVPLRIALNPTDVAEGLRLDVPAVADVPPGTVVEVPIAVYGPWRLIGRAEPKTFSIVAEPPKPLAPARLPGTRVVVPLFPKWVPVAAAGLAVAAVAAAAVVPKLTAHHTPGQASPTSPAPTSQSSGQSSAAPSAAQSAAAPSAAQSAAAQSPAQSSAPQSPAQSPTTPAATPQSTTPIISGVSFAGGTAAPTVTVTGHGFGASAPAGVSANTTSCGGYTSNGEDYGTSNLQFVDIGNFEAGGGVPPGGDCIGLEVQSWSADQVVFGFGNAYNSFDHWYITDGDQYAVTVKNLHYTGTVSFSG